MILVSIVGDFDSSIFPIFYEFKEKITKHIVVHDDATKDKKEYDKLIKSLNKFTTKHNLNIETVKFPIDEDSLDSILTLTSYLKLISSDLKKVHINITDGLSNVGLVVGTKMLAKGAKLLAYDMHENTYNVITAKKIVTKKVLNSINIKDHFLLKGLKFVASQNKEFAHKYEKEIKQLFETHSSSFEKVKADIFFKHRLVEKSYPKVYELLKTMGLTQTLDEKLITGGLFEYYVYLLVCDLGFDDIEIGVEIKQKFAQNNNIPNEFDILLMKDNHLHMIECKYTKKAKLSDLVYKYSSLINLIDDDGKIIILTQKKRYNPNIYDNRITSLHNHRRAFINNILVRGNVVNHQEEFISDVKNYFNISRKKYE